MKTELRKEIKLIKNESELIIFFKKHSKKLEEIYEPRKITSLYFDTIDNSLFKNSKFGDVNTIKVRVRNYSNSKNFYKEIKYNLFSGKYKSVEEMKIGNFNDVEKLFSNQYTLYPSVYTQYDRRYFKLLDCRLTLDTNISFFSHNFRSKSVIRKNFKNNVLEYKALNFNYDIEKYVESNPVAFSKFKNAVNKVYDL